MTALPHDPARSATKDDIVALQGDLGALKADLAVVAARIDVVEANLRGEIKAANSELLRTLFFGMVASNATLVGLVFAAVRLA